MASVLGFAIKCNGESIIVPMMQVSTGETNDLADWMAFKCPVCGKYHAVVLDTYRGNVRVVNLTSDYLPSFWDINAARAEDGDTV